ncbi:MAG: hybrid sensor histidine kinase/response regulator [Gammaproteobacteria bacterium]|nr:hybrid sensor histidine kinase/response regulator [Gammaproteobacteria bacterium]MDH5592083.1 hybrid sensor histidine kinase/response regulator [Gammaproteobacteria bacterium]
MKLMKILVVDDVETIRQYLSKVLEPLQAAVTEAADGDQAFELIKNNEYDIIFMDIEMPGKSGLEVIKRVRKQLGFKFTPIIVMTGLEQPELIQQAFDCGASDYISKPLSEIEILARLKIRIENRNLDRELRLARIAAEKANYAKSEFITRLAHELKTPLNAINGFNQLIELNPTDPESILESCAYIKTAIKHQDDLINEVTNLAQIEAGIMDMDLSEVELSDIIKDAFSLTKPMADKFSVTLKLPRRDNAKYKITADNKRMKQVMLNLISNAIKYNKPNGEVSIQVKPELDGHIKVGISDTGVGIAKNKLPKLFEPFNRLGAENTEIEGSGIGLSITKKIIELMGGRLEVESTEGEGSTFWVSMIGHQVTT